MPKVIVHLEGDSFEELRIEACRVLDLRILNTAPAEIKVAELIAELDASPEIPEKAELPVTDEPAKKPKRAPRKKGEPDLTAIADIIEGTPRKLDLESVKEAFSEYSQKFGVAAAQEDGPILLGRIFGEGVVNRIRDVPVDDQAKLGRLIAAVNGAALTNEFKRDTVQ